MCKKEVEGIRPRALHWFKCVYNYFRDYQPSIGRYVQSDPIRVWGGENLYLYSSASPVRRLDRLGLSDSDCCDRERKDAGHWGGFFLGFSAMALVAGFSGEVALLKNSESPESCLVTMGCIRLGPGIGVSAGGGFKMSFVGPYCGKDLTGGTCQLTAKWVSGWGFRGSFGLGCGGVSPSIGIYKGGEASFTFDICYLHVLRCFDTPCECE